MKIEIHCVDMSGCTGYSIYENGNLKPLAKDFGAAIYLKGRFNTLT